VRQATATVMVVLLLIGMITLTFKVMAHSPEPKRARGYYPFELTFRRDLGNLTDSTPEIEELYIKSYLDMTPIALWASVKFNYTQGLSDLEKIALQDNVQDELESKWYINFVERNYAIWIPEDPPPPWPGFEIGALNVRFVSVFPVYTINSTLGYKTIQEAINANETLEGHTIFVSSGTYYENIVVNKAVSLIGENSVTTIIDGGGVRSPVEVLVDNVTIAGFNIRNSSLAYRFAGVALQSVKFCNVSWNILTGNNDGIYAEYSLNNTFCHNFILGNDWNGVHLKYDCRYNSIASNTILNSRTGISLEASSISNFILFNYIAECEWHGILTYCSSNSIIGNTITNCFTGIYLSEEMNVIYHNNFIGNTYQITCYSAPNVWDNGYPSGGNYWGSPGVDEYSGPYQNETGSDGIMDYAHVIDAGNKDHYPLMNPYWNPADVNHDLKVNIYDAVLICAAYSSTPSDPHWNPHCDIAEPYGVIDIYDIVMICSSYGEEYLP